MTSCLVLSGMGFVPFEQPSDLLQVNAIEQKLFLLIMRTSSFTAEHIFKKNQWCLCEGPELRKNILR